MITILSFNINDFGGKDIHLMEYKKWSRQGRDVIDWVAWRDLVDKKPACNAILAYIQKENPDIVFLQEFEVNNSPESKIFVATMEEMGYRMLNAIPSFKASISVVFTKTSCVLLDPVNTLHMRSYAVQIGDMIVYGVHVPPKGSDRIVQFWDEIDRFYQHHRTEKVMLLGDFNIVNVINGERYLQLLDHGGIDLWLQKGYADDVPTCGTYRMDMAIVTEPLLPRVHDITIDTRLLDEGMSDHAALLIKIKDDVDAVDSE